MNGNPYPSLKSFNTFGFDVTCKQLICINRSEEIIDFQQQGYFNKPFKIISGGSNILLTQNLEEVIFLNRIKGIEKIKETNDHVFIKFGAGESWHEVVKYCVDLNLGGIENMSLIPGCIGAAPIQNIGAYGAEIKDVFDHLSAINLHTGKTETFYLEECQFGYRDSVFKNQKKDQYFIVDVCLKLDKSPQVKIQYGDIQNTLSQMNITHPTIKDVSNAVIAIRKSKLPDPVEIGNSGSFFKNPVVPIAQALHLAELYPDIKTFPVNDKQHKLAAGWLIEKAGWKGFRSESVGVHEKQALVLVHYGGGKGSEVAHLAKQIQTDIHNKFGVFLEFEVNIW